MRKWWPSNPVDAKAMFISLAASAGVAMIVAFYEVLKLINDKTLTVLATPALFFIISYVFFWSLNNYRHIRKGEESIEAAMQKTKKKT